MNTDQNPPTIIVATQRPSEVAFAQAVAQALQIPLQTISEVGKIKDALSAAKNATLIFDSAIADPTKVVGEFNGLIKYGRVHLLTSGMDMRAIASHFECDSFGHFILRKVDENAAEDGALYSRVVLASLRENSMGLRSLQFAENQIESIQFSATLQKKFAATSVTYFLQENGFNEQLCSTVGTAVDELLMNAMVDAIHEGASGSSAGEVQMEVSLDQNVLGITVADHHGSLNRSKVLSHLKKNFGDELVAMRGAEAHGAGIGLSQILKAGGSVLFNVEVGKRTEASLLFRKAKSYREVRKQMQFLSTLESKAT